MNQYLVLGNTFNFRHLLPFDSNKALYEYKNMALTDLLQKSREVGNLHWWIIKQHIVGAESAFITSHSGNPNAYSLAVKRNKIEARSTAGLLKFLIFMDIPVAERRADKMRAAVESMGRLHVSTRIWNCFYLDQVSWQK